MCLEKRLHRILSVDEMQFGFMSDRGTTNAMFILRWLREEYYAKEERYMCFVGLKKVFDKVPRKLLEWAMRKKGIPKVLVRSVICLYEGANI